LTQQQYTVPPKIPGSTDPDFDNAAGQGGAICLDGFLNIGDEGIYHVNEFKLPNQSREVQRFWTGGRPFANAIIVEVIEEGATSSVFNVSIDDTDPVRKLVDVPLLNGTILVGDKTTLATNAGASVVLSRPGTPLTIDGIFMNPGGGGTIVRPVQITSLTSPGASGTLAVVQELTDNGDVNTAATLISGVLPVPFPQFIRVGDKGTFFTATVLDTTTTPGDGSTISTKFFLSSRQNFTRFV
jgi:hypothetical protein